MIVIRFPNFNFNRIGCFIIPFDRGKHPLMTGMLSSGWSQVRRVLLPHIYIWDYLNLDQMADHSLKLWAFFYCVPFSVQVIRTCLMDVPRIKLRSGSFEGFQNTFGPKMFGNESTWNEFCSHTILLQICLKGDFLVPFLQTSLEEA